MRTIAITGREGSGKTTLAINLAMALRHLGRKVVLIDANIDNPDVSLYINAHPHKTLNDHLDGKCSIDHAVYRHASGTGIIFSALKHEDEEFTMRDINKLSADFVIIDSPGFGKAAKSIIHASSDIIFVSAPHVNSAFDVARYNEIVQGMEKKPRVMGTVLNNVTKSVHELSAKEVAVFTGVPIITSIPHSKDISASSNSRRPVLTDPKSKQARPFLELARFLCKGGTS